MVGKFSRIRVSSVITIFPSRSSVGTLKSTRTSTRCPRTSRSRSDNLFMLMILIVLLILVIAARIILLAEHISPLGKPFEQSDHHPKNRRQFAFGAAHLLVGRKFACHENIESSRAFQRRATRHFEKTRPVLDRKFA